ncbi:MAG: MraY family glycosyltransferase [Phycisphaerales bacterium]
MTLLVLALIPAAFLLGFPATLAARTLGRRLNALDGRGVPGQVKAPPRRVPNTGGIGIFAAFAACTLAALTFVWLFINNKMDLPVFLEPLRAHFPGVRAMTAPVLILLSGALALHVLGLIDDRRPLGPNLKLLVMLAVSAAVVVATDSRLFTMLDPHVGGPWLSVLVTVAWIVAVTNAFNFLDNMDGLSGGVAAVAAACFLTTALVNDPPQWFIAAMIAVLLGSILGFLVFNFPWKRRVPNPDGSATGGASIFMGDGGSLVVGFLLAVLSVRITYVPAGHDLAPHLLLIPVLILAIPLYDFASVILIRLRQGKSPFVGDLQHFSHRLVRHGLSQRAAVLLICGCAAITGIGAIALPALAPWQAALVGLQSALTLGVLALYEWKKSG